MNKREIKAVVILSGLAGLFLAIAALIPFVVKIAVFILMTCVSVPILVLLRRNGALENISVKESLCVGALSGFIAYLAFSIVYLPLVSLLSYFFALGYLGGFVLMLKLSNIWLVLMFSSFISVVSVLFNAFSSLLWYYVTSSIDIGEKNDRI